MSSSGCVSLSPPASPLPAALHQPRPRALCDRRRRCQRLTAQLKATPGLIPVTISRGRVEDWADPIVGVAAHWRITDRWFLNALADVGGFGVGSQFTAQGFASIGYQWTPSISTSVGYRAIYTDYRASGFLYSITQHGLEHRLSLLA